MAATRSCVVSADAGRTKLAKKFAEMLDTIFAIISKERPSHNEARVMEVIGADEVQRPASRSSPTT